MILLKAGNIFTEIVGELPEPIKNELERRLSFRPQGFVFSPAYNRWVFRNGKRVRVWDGWRRQFWSNKTRTYFPTGLYSIAAEYFKSKGVSYRVQDCRDRPNETIQIEDSGLYVERDYQQTVIEDSCNASRGIIQVPTGGGKSIIGAGIIRRIKAAPFLFFVTSVDLLTQAKDTFEKAFRLHGDPMPIGQIGGGVIDIQNITVCTIQSVVRALGKQWNSKTRFDSDDSDDKTPIEKYRNEIVQLIADAKGIICDECITGDAQVVTRDGLVRMDRLSDYVGEDILSFNGKNVVWKKITHFYDKGKQKILKVVLSNGMAIRCTEDHPIMTNRGWVPSRQICCHDLILCCDSAVVNNASLSWNEAQTDTQNTYLDTVSYPKLNSTFRTACDISYVKVESISFCDEESVFDITVDGSHCFFANGMLVHNCQHWKAETCQLVTQACKSAYYRYGMSATPWRDEGDDMLIQACFGKKCAVLAATDLIDRGYLVRPHIKFIHLKNRRSQFRQWQSIYKDRIVDDELYNGMIANIANSYVERDRLVLVLVQQIEHGKNLAEMIKGAKFLSGKSTKLRRERSLNQLRNRYIRCIVSSSLPYEELLLVKHKGWIRQIEIGDLCDNYEKEINNREMMVWCSFDGKTGAWSRITKGHAHKRQNRIVKVQTDRHEDIFVTENHSLLSPSLQCIEPQVGHEACSPALLPPNESEVKEIDLISLLGKINDPAIEIRVLGVNQSLMRQYNKIHKYYSNPDAIEELKSRSERRHVRANLSSYSEEHKKAICELVEHFRYYKGKFRAPLVSVQQCKHLFKFFECRIYIHRSRKKFELPTKLMITPELAIVSGIICGDGHIKHHTKGETCKSIYAFDFSGLSDLSNSTEAKHDENKRKIREIFTTSFRKVFGDVEIFSNWQHLRFRNKLIYYLFKELGHIGKSGEKRVPDYIYNASKAIQERFLWGLYLSDGNKKINYNAKEIDSNKYSAINIHNSSRPLICGVIALLKMLNKKYYMSSIALGKHAKKRRYTISVLDPICGLIPQNVRDGLDYKTSSRIQKEVLFTSRSDEHVYDISVEGCENFVAGCGILAHNTIFDEGIDVRPLDTVILAGGGKSKTRAMQRIGRICRPYESSDGIKKTHATAIDFWIHDNYLGDHAAAREEMYRTEPGYLIEHIDPDLD